MAKLSPDEIHSALQQLPEWQLSGSAITRTFEFSDFMQAMDFVNQVARAAEEANHHPDITINYNKVTMQLSSHDSGGVTQRDVRMAARISEIAGSRTEKAA